MKEKTVRQGASNSTIQRLNREKMAVGQENIKTGWQAAKKARSTDWIEVFGAREHNLKNIDVALPKNALTVITGPSGSGKSSLALDILFTEGKRRYVESLSSYARQFLGVSKRPEVDRIEGLCPAIAIEQKTVGANPRSTVGTITEIYDYLRVLFARVGKPHCPDCHLEISAQSPEQITTMLATSFAGKMITIAAPLAIDKKGEFVNELTSLFQERFYRFRIDGQRYKFKTVDEIKALKLQKSYKHTIDLLIDQLEVDPAESARLHEVVQLAFARAGGTCRIIAGDEEFLYASSRVCLRCAQSVPELEPRCFSFNSPIGACPECHGLGIIHEWPWKDSDPDSWKAQYPDFLGDKYATILTCGACYGQRLNKHALAVTVGDKNIFEIGQLSITACLTFFKNFQLASKEQEIAQGLIHEIVARLTFLHDVGLSYLSLNRSARTLSGGEGQRIRLATQIGSALSGVLYILDEPSIGLHQRDNDRLINTLKHLRDQGNTVVVVEHDSDTMWAADYLIDMGPAAGVLGGQVTAVGTPSEVSDNQTSLTGAYLSGRRSIAIPTTVRRPQGYLRMHHAQKNNLKDVSVQFPLGLLCCVSGVSGSGKSTLIMQELVPALEREFIGARSRARDAYAAREKTGISKKNSLEKRESDDQDPACELDTVRNTPHSRGHDHDLEGADALESMVVIDQSPIGRTPRSNPATYLGIFDAIRELFASLPESNARGYKVGRFSFNVAEGRCFECNGDGAITVQMHFLPEVSMVCKSCHGQRYNKETLAITYKGKNIAQVLDMTAYEALSFFAAHPRIAKRIQLMCDVGLDYVKLGQPSTTLSGGEAQRIKLVDELAKRGSKTLYILDEPTTGLHTSDIERLLGVLNKLIDKGNSMIIIEHNLDVLKTADYIIDLGPEGGDNGGTIVAQGTPREISGCPHSYTGQYLKRVFSQVSSAQCSTRSKKL
jgi:excinuclease ABC subunit A